MKTLHKYRFTNCLFQRYKYACEKWNKKWSGVLYTVGVILPLLLCSSCAMLFNEKSQCIKIYTDSTLRLTAIDSTRLLYHEPGDQEFYVRRGRQPLKLQFENSKGQHLNFYLNRRLSPAYFLANAASPFALGYVADLFHEKRFMYSPQNYFSYDTLRHQVLYDVVRPSATGELSVYAGWNFASIYHPALFKTNQLSATINGFHASAVYVPDRGRSFQAELGYAFANGPSQNKRYAVSAPFDSVSKYKLTNLWLLATYRLHYRHWVLGAGVSLAGLKNYEKRDYYITYDSIQAIPLDTFSVTKYRYSSSQMTPLFKAGLHAKAECRINHFVTLGANWQLYCADINTPALYASHFFNFYVALNVYRTNLLRKRKPHASN